MRISLCRSTIVLTTLSFLPDVLGDAGLCLHHLRHEAAYGFRRLILHLAGGVGVGAEGGACGMNTRRTVVLLRPGFPGSRTQPTKTRHLVGRLAGLLVSKLQEAQLTSKHPDVLRATHLPAYHPCAGQHSAGQADHQRYPASFTPSSNRAAGSSAPDSGSEDRPGQMITEISPH